MIHPKRHTIALLLTAALLAAETTSAADEPSAGRQWFPESHGMSQIRFFSNQEGELEKKRFVTEAVLKWEYMILATASGRNVWWDVTFSAGMGESVADSLPFAPIDTTYASSAYLESPLTDRLTYRAGWQHACYHLIYKDNAIPWYHSSGVNVEPDVYFNKLFIGLGSRTIRGYEQHRNAFHREGATSLNRLAWYVEGGHYLQSLFDLMEPQAIHGGNDWAWDLTVELKYLLYTNRAFALFLNNRTVMLLDGANDDYWRDVVELECMLRGGKYTGSLFAGATPIDEHPRDAREGLLELGARFVF